jgi:2-methylcitrate dehydratase PrpD
VGKLTAVSTGGRSLDARVDEPKGDPGNTLTAAELEAKAMRLAAFRAGATANEMASLVARIWKMDDRNEPALTLPR